MPRVSAPTLFLLLGGVIGLAVLAANPPFQAADETDHFFREFQLSEGTLVGVKQDGMAGGFLPPPIIGVSDMEGIPLHPDVKMTAAEFRQKATPLFMRWSGQARVFWGFAHTVIYPPLAYLPQALAVALGRLCRIGPLGLFYLARLAGFGASLALAWGALRLLPIYRWSAMLLLLGPMSLYLRGAAAPDAVLASAAFLLAAWTLSHRVGPRHEMSASESVRFLLLAGFVAAVKAVYFPLSLAALLLASASFGSRRRRVGFVLVGLGLCLLPLILWSRVYHSLWVPGRPGVHLDPDAQIRHVLHAPLDFVRLLIATVRLTGPTIWSEFVGVLGWLDTVLPLWFYPAYGCALLGCVILESPPASGLTWNSRLLFAAAAITAFVLVYAALYAEWNPPGSNAPIEGIQGRYFLPLAPFALGAVPKLLPSSWRTERAAAVLGSAAGLGSALVCLHTVVTRYYLR